MLSRGKRIYLAFLDLKKTRGINNKLRTCLYSKLKVVMLAECALANGLIISAKNEEKLQQNVKRWETTENG